MLPNTNNNKIKKWINYYIIESMKFSKFEKCSCSSSVENFNNLWKSEFDNSSGFESLSTYKHSILFEVLDSSNNIFLKLLGIAFKIL